MKCDPAPSLAKPTDDTTLSDPKKERTVGLLSNLRQINAILEDGIHSCGKTSVQSVCHYQPDAKPQALTMW